MKWFLSILMVATLSLVGLKVMAQDEKKEEKNRFEEEVPEELKYYKQKYDATYKEPIELVIKAVAKSIADLPCEVIQNTLKATEDGFLKGVIKSDYCVFVEGDSTYDKLKIYSLKMPFIRAGAWSNGRMQYKFTITQQPDSTCYLILKGAVSGFEKYVTYKVHFWESNGILETRLMESIERNIKLLKETGGQ